MASASKTGSRNGPHIAKAKNAEFHSARTFEIFLDVMRRQITVSALKKF
jgi:hypothetical protein